MSSLLDKKINYTTLIRFTLPTIVSIVFMGIYTTVDGVFISRLLGTDALSSLNIVMPIVTFSLAIGAMFGSGGTAVVAKKIGQGKLQEARENFTLILLVTFVSSTVLSILGLIFVEPLVTFLGADELLFQNSLDYSIITLILLPLCIVSFAFQMFFITEGKTNYGLILSIIGGVSNIVLDYVFMVPFDWGISGAALATSIGYSIQSLISLIYFIRNKNGTLYIVKPKWDLKVILKTCTNGASEMVTNISAGIITLLLNNILMALAGSNGVASITIILYVQGLLASMYMGYSMGISPMISYNYGKKSEENLKAIYKISLKFIGFVSFITFFISIIFSQQLVSIFATKGTEVFDMASRGYTLFSFAFLFIGFNIFSSAMFTSFSDGKTSAILSFFRTFIFIVVSVLTLPKILNLDGVWVSIPLAEFFGILMTLYYFKKFKSVYKYA